MTPDRSKDPRLERRRHLKNFTVGGFFLLVLVLLYGGLRGRQHARLQARVDDVAVLRDQLQQQLNDDPRATNQFAAGFRGIGTNAMRSRLSNPQVMALVNALKTRLEQLDFDYSPNKLSGVEGFEIRLSRATLANAEQRFADALMMITLADEGRIPVSNDAQIGRFIRVLQIRGDALYGLREWQDALDRYRGILGLRPDRISAIARVAECQYSLGRTNDALTSYEELAKSQGNRGDDFLLRGKLDAAVGHYAKAIGIQAGLIEHEGRTPLADELAVSHQKRGDVFLVQRKLEAAVGDFEKSIEILTRLIEKEGRKELVGGLALSHHKRGNAFLVQGNLEAAVGAFENAIKILNGLIEREGRQDLASDLEMSHENRGNALLAQGKLDAALVDFEKAIQILTPLVEKEGRSELANDLARSHNNLGVVHRAQGKPDAAVRDFENAIRILSGLVEKEPRGESAGKLTGNQNRPAVRRTQVKLEAAMGYSEDNLEALVRTRLAEQRPRKELAIVLAVSLKNRAYAHVVQGKPDVAIGDFNRAMGIYARLVEQEGETDLALQYARSLSPIAWLYATNPGSSFRDGSKARQYAVKACELTDWKAFGPVETLAAACAETGNFAEAIKWQEKAFELAPAKNKGEVRSRLELYKSGNPYRTPVPRAG